MSESLHAVIRVEGEPGGGAEMEEEGSTWEAILARLRRHVVRVVLTPLVVAGAFCLVVLGVLAVKGMGPFKQVRGSDTCLRPVWYYHYILIVKHFGIIFIAINALCTVIQKVVSAQVGRHSGAVPVPFLFMFVLSLSLNIGLLFAEDHINASGSLALSFILCFSNCVALSYSVPSFNSCAKSMYRECCIDFWVGVGCLNFMALYVAWSLIQCLISLSVFLIYESMMNSRDVCLGELIVLMLLLLVWFIFENKRLTKVFGTIVLHYLGVVYYLVTLVIRQVEGSGKLLQALYWSALVLMVALMALHVVSMYRANRGNKQYGISAQESSM